MPLGQLEKFERSLSTKCYERVSVDFWLDGWEVEEHHRSYRARANMLGGMEHHHMGSLLAGGSGRKMACPVPQLFYNFRVVLFSLMNTSTTLLNVTSLKLMSISIKNVYRFYAALYTEEYTTSENEIQAGRHTICVVLCHTVTQISWQNPYTFDIQ